MASVTLKAPDRFPVGTTVGAYPRSQWNFWQLPPSGAPPGAAVTTAVVSADGSIAFTGLADDTRYYAGADVGGWRYIAFQTSPAAAAAAGAVSLAERKRALWLPTGAIDSTMDRWAVNASVTMPASGTLRLAGGVVIPAGQAVTSISFLTTTTLAVTPTNQWFALVRVSDLAVLAKTADDGAAAWGANAVKTLAIAGGPYTPSVETAVYLGILIAAATMPTLGGIATGVGPQGIVPLFAGNSNTGLTNPASLGAAATAPTPATGIPYAFIS